MKKRLIVIVLTTIILSTVCLFSACSNGANNDISSIENTENIEGIIIENVKIIQRGSDGKVPSFSPIIINNTNELRNYTDSIFSNQIVNYNDEFFEKKSVIVWSYSNNHGLTGFQIYKISKTSDSLIINYKTPNYNGVAFDVMSYWIECIVLNKIDIEGLTSIKTTHVGYY